MKLVVTATACTSPVQARQTRQEVPPLAKERLTSDRYWRGSVHILLKMLPLESQPCSSGKPHTQEDRGGINCTWWVEKEDRKLSGEGKWNWEDLGEG